MTIAAMLGLIRTYVWIRVLVLWTGESAPPPDVADGVTVTMTISVVTTVRVMLVVEKDCPEAALVVGVDAGTVVVTITGPRGEALLLLLLL